MWQVVTTNVFNDWLSQQDNATQEKVLSALIVLSQHGPNLGRPLVDTVYNSKHTNMKELRVQHKGQPIRAFFAFDPARQAIILCVGNKGGNEKRFYKQMIPIADELYKQHLQTLETGK